MKIPEKILIFRLSSIGDIILTTPLVRCLKQQYPNMKLTYVVKKEFAGLLKYNPHIDQLWEFDKNTGFAGLKELKKKIKTARFDYFIDIHKSLRSRFVRMGSAARHITKYHKKIFIRTLLVKFKVNLYRENKLVFLRYFEAVKKLGVQYDGQGSEVFFSNNEDTFVSTKLNQVNIQPADKLFVICPGASYTNKQWIPERFAEIADKASNELNMKVCLLGGSNDVALCDKIQHISSSKPANLAGQFKLLESAALLKRATLVLSNDSGMMHLAQSQKTPVVAIFGPTTKELGYFPMPEKSRVVESNETCRPCSHKGLNHCPEKHFNCMLNVSGKIVEDAIISLLHP